MKLHRLQSSQWLPLKPEEAWDFFSIPENLDRITPNDMSFKILSGGGEKTFSGHIICYTIKPLFGIPMKWVTEITHEEKGVYFIDEQRFGPYRFWHHMHRFTPDNGGVLMEDVLHYALPFGLLGELFGGFVHRKVKGIFSFREKTLETLFPGARSVD
ncbi:MAG: SRPBCC family protein [Flavobacteriales bacterium]|nr:SRPBCC family protein [Flavobacteriales bacterium]